MENKLTGSAGKGTGVRGQGNQATPGNGSGVKRKRPFSPVTPKPKDQGQDQDQLEPQGQAHPPATPYNSASANKKKNINQTSTVEKNDKSTNNNKTNKTMRAQSSGPKKKKKRMDNTPFKFDYSLLPDSISNEILMKLKETNDQIQIFIDKQKQKINKSKSQTPEPQTLNPALNPTLTLTHSPFIIGFNAVQRSLNQIKLKNKYQVNQNETSNKANKKNDNNDDNVNDQGNSSLVESKFPLVVLLAGNLSTESRSLFDVFYVACHSNKIPLLALNNDSYQLGQALTLNSCIALALKPFQFNTTTTQLNTTPINNQENNKNDDKNNIVDSEENYDEEIKNIRVLYENLTNECLKYAEIPSIPWLQPKLDNIIYPLTDK